MPPLNVCIQVNVSRRGEQERRARRRKLPALARAVARAAAAAPARPDGDSRADRRLGAAAPALRVAARTARPAATRRAWRSTRCRWACRDDLEAAITEGATMVRVGTAIFGERTARRRMKITFHRRRQHGDRADRRPAAQGFSAAGMQVVEPDGARRASACTDSFGVRCAADGRCGGAQLRRAGAGGQAAADAGRLAPLAGHSCTAQLVISIAAGIRLADIALARRLSPAGALHAQYAGADRRRHHRPAMPTPSVDREGRAHGRNDPRRGRRHAVGRRRGADRCGDGDFRQRPGLCVLFHRGAGERRREALGFEAETARAAGGRDLRRRGAAGRSRASDR